MSDTQSSDPDWDVFFSYDRDDAEQAKRIARALAERRFRVWIDSEEILAAERWAEEIETGLRSSRVYAMMVTRRALASRWVQDEYLAALTIGNTEGRPRIVALVAEDVPLPLFMSIRQWVDFRGETRFETALQELERCIRAGKAGAAARVTTPVPASTPRFVVSDSQLAYLERSLGQAHKRLHDVRMVRRVGVALGVLAALPAIVAAAAGALLFLAAPLVVGLVAWAATEPFRAQAAGRENRLLFVRDRLKECRQQYDPSCDQAVAEFWRLVHGDPAARFAAEATHGR